MNLGGTKTSPLIMQREPSCQKCSPQIPCVITNRTSGYRKGEKIKCWSNALLFSPCPLFGQGLGSRAGAPIFSPNISKRLNPMSSTSSGSPLPRRRPPGLRSNPSSKSSRGPSPDSTQTPKGLQPLTTDVRKAQPGPRGAAPAPQRPPPPSGPRRAQKGRARPRLSLGLGRARKKESALSAALPLHSSSEVGTRRAKDGQCQGEGRR